MANRVIKFQPGNLKAGYHVHAIPNSCGEGGKEASVLWWTTLGWGGESTFSLLSLASACTLKKKKKKKK